jgi:hypothetical protein
METTRLMMADRPTPAGDADMRASESSRVGAGAPSSHDFAQELCAQ